MILAKELAKPLKKLLEKEQRPLTEENAKTEQKAEELDSFLASEGWLSKFKHRHSITFRSNQGEAGAVDLEELGNWQQDVLQAEISKFSPNDVFNADETGLFWQLLPNKTLAFKGWLILV